MLDIQYFFDVRKTIEPPKYFMHNVRARYREGAFSVDGQGGALF